MTTNAEKLARELIALSERYSKRDFERASELLLSGKFFSQVVGTAKAARGKAKHVAQDTTSQVELKGVPSKAQLSAQLKAESPDQLDLVSLLNDVEEAERMELISFATRFQNREILGSRSATRAFAQQIGIDLSKSMPARAALAKNFIRRLREVPRDVRSNLIREADRIGTGESSLKQWSDLIVKRNPL
jgi:hypothetical protein